MRNPQAFQQYEQLKRSNGNPQEFLSQITGNFNEQQRQAFINTAKNFGFSEEQLKGFGINTK